MMTSNVLFPQLSTVPFGLRVEVASSDFTMLMVLHFVNDLPLVSRLFPRAESK